MGGGGAGSIGAFNGYVLVAQHGQPIYSRAFGLADRERQRPATADTSFRIGSVTKQFTAAAILKLEQDGKLSVSDPVSKHLPGYTGPAKDVTIHQLLTHTGGVPSYTDDPSVLARKAQRWSVVQLLATFEFKPLAFAPGSKFAYSNSGYALLGAIIELVSGRTYGDYLRDELFVPAGLTRTVVGDALDDPDRANGYQLDGDRVVPADPIDMGLPYAAGAIRSTANDLVRWHRALEGDAILGAAAKAKLYTPALKDYAYGWMVGEQAGHKLIWHNGGIDGFHTSYFRVPDADLVVVVLGNTLQTDTDEIAKNAIAAAFGEAVEPLPVADAALVARVVGTYTITPAGQQALGELKAPAELIAAIQTMTIAAVPGGVSMKPNGQGPALMSPSGGATFVHKGAGITLTFDLAATGAATGLTIEQGPLKITYARAP